MQIQLKEPEPNLGQLSGILKTKIFWSNRYKKLGQINRI